MYCLIDYSFTINKLSLSPDYSAVVSFSAEMFEFNMFTLQKQEMHLSYCLLGSDKLQRFIDDFYIQEQFDI